MTRYLFRFGYQTPEIFNTDMEDSDCVWIDAPDESAALDWGQEVAEAYVRDHYPTLPSWKQSGYASWIETKDAEALSWATENPVPVCQVGEFPDWTD